MPQPSLPLFPPISVARTTMELQGSHGWEDMELDCLVSIFSKLGLDDLTLSIPFVCKSWSQASADPNCWRVLDFRGLDLKPSGPFAAGFSAQYSVARFTFSGFLKFAVASSRRAALELRFSPLFPASLEVLSLASKECPRLKALTLPRISTDDEDRFLNLVANWKDLEWLEMESKPSNLTEIVKQIGIHCRSFHGLKLRGSFSKEESLGIANSLPKLGSLDLSGSRLGKAELLAMVNGCRELRRLRVNDCVGFESGDGEVKSRTSGIEVFEDEGCRINGDSDEADVWEQLFMRYHDCFEMWQF